MGLYLCKLFCEINENALLECIVIVIPLLACGCATVCATSVIVKLPGLARII